jgi:general secretion pathway protein D
LRVYRKADETDAPPPVDGELSPAGPAAPGTAPETAPAAAVAAPQANGAPAPSPELSFEPANATLKAGDRTTIGLAVADVNDLYSIPLLIHYDPAVVRVEEVRDGGFLSGGTQSIAIVQNIDDKQGQVIVSATRRPNTPGVSGSGTILGIVVRAIAPGAATLQVLQSNARDSQQHPIPMVSKEAKIQVQ